MDTQQAARRWIDARSRAEAGFPLSRLLLDGLRGRLRIDSFTLTSHHFMSPAEVQTDLGFVAGGPLTGGNVIVSP